MSRLSAQLFVLVLFVQILACGGRRVGDSPSGTSEMSGPTTGSVDSSDPSETNTGAPSSSDTSVPLPDCEEPWVACPGDSECVSLFGNVTHCGECNHSCRGVGVSARCSNYQCEPGVWPCIPRGSGFATCAEACAGAGEVCAVDAYCSGYVEVWLTSGANDDDPEQNLEACMIGFGGQTNFELGCNDPIDWDYEVGGRTVVGVACCCTQP